MDLGQGVLIGGLRGRELDRLLHQRQRFVEPPLRASGQPGGVVVIGRA
jgi:hypothetical protein